MDREKIIFWDIVKEIDIDDLYKLYGTIVERYSWYAEDIANKYPEEYDKYFNDILIDRIDVYKDKIYLYSEREIFDILTFEQFHDLLEHKEVSSTWREFDVDLQWSNEGV